MNGMQRAALIVLAIAFGVAPVRAAGFEWQSRGAYEICLEGEADEWLTNKAELLVANDAGVKALNDGDVAAFSIAAMRACSGKGAPASETSDGAFAKYMAHWRQHLYELAKVVRAKGGLD